MHLQVIPGILEHDWQSIEVKLEQIKSFASAVHIDLIDGKFVNNLTFADPGPFKKYSSDLFLELHMMVVDPGRIIEPWGRVGFRRFLGHVEQMTSQKEFVEQAKKYGEAGLALDGPTHISAIKVPFETLDAVLVYTSNRVGFSGPPLLDDRLDKIRHLRKLTNIPIEADGGINDRTLAKARGAGATRFVSTGYISSSENPGERYKKLTSLLL